VYVYAHVVVTETLAVLGRDALGLPEIDVACQLTNHHHVHAAHNLTERGGGRRGGWEWRDRAEGREGGEEGGGERERSYV
jgi:hypothetical protein